MKIILLLTISLFLVANAGADTQSMTDRDIISLYDSANGEETALRSLLPPRTFTLQVLIKDGYKIIDREAPELQVSGYEPTNKYRIEGCWSKKNRGICIRIDLNDTEVNKQKLRIFKTSPAPIEFLVNFDQIDGWDNDGKKYKILSFDENLS